MEDVDDCCNGGACWPVGKLITGSHCRGSGWVKEVPDNSSLRDSSKILALLKLDESQHVVLVGWSLVSYECKHTSIAWRQLMWKEKC